MLLKFNNRFRFLLGTVSIVLLLNSSSAFAQINRGFFDSWVAGLIASQYLLEGLSVSEINKAIATFCKRQPKLGIRIVVFDDGRVFINADGRGIWFEIERGARGAVAGHATAVLPVGNVAFDATVIHKELLNNNFNFQRRNIPVPRAPEIISPRRYARRIEKLLLPHCHDSLARLRRISLYDLIAFDHLYRVEGATELREVFRILAERGLRLDMRDIAGNTMQMLATERRDEMFLAALQHEEAEAEAADDDGSENIDEAQAANEETQGEHPLEDSEPDLLVSGIVRGATTL